MDWPSGGFPLRLVPRPRMLVVRARIQSLQVATTAEAINGVFVHMRHSFSSPDVVHIILNSHMDVLCSIFVVIPTY